MKMIEKDKFFKLHNQCVLVEGKYRSAIYDLQRKDFYFIPNSYAKIIKNYKKKLIRDIYDIYSKEQKGLDDFFIFMRENELIFFTNELIKFPETDYFFDKPTILDTVFLELYNFQNFKNKFIQSIDAIGCSQLILIMNDSNCVNFTKRILRLLENSRILKIFILADFDTKSLSYFNEKNNLIYNNRLSKIIFFNSKKNRKLNNQVKLVKSNLEGLLSKRIKHPKDFLLNTDSYSESLKYNLFFNRKVYVNDKGDIKNYFNQKNKFGNIEKDDLKTIVGTKKYQRLWRITKDQIEVCNVCEFRFACPDNRIPIFDEKKNMYTHLNDCNYDSEKNQWKTIVN